MSADLTPRAVPAIDRRRPDPRPEAVRLDPEAARAAVEEAEVAEKAGVGLANIAILALLAGLRSLKESARRGACYPLRNGTKLEASWSNDDDPRQVPEPDWSAIREQGKQKDV